MIPRLLNISKTSSFFLFGARGTGKSTLLSTLFDPKVEPFEVFDLLLPEFYDPFLRSSQNFVERLDALPASVRWVVIDEIQRLPELLNVVHSRIEQRKLKFALTGSSARKLRRGDANLLAGRSFIYHLFPLTQAELGEGFSLDSALNWGSLPRLQEITEARDRQKFLTAYTHTYLREEIAAEQLVRDLPPFSRFLEIAAQMDGELINFAAIGRQSKIDEKTVRTYYGILEDTLLGFFLKPYARSVRKTQLQSSRFFLFDSGVKRSLEGSLESKLTPGTAAYGKAFEHFIVRELHRRNSYADDKLKFSFLRTQGGMEVDLVVEQGPKTIALIEIKSTKDVSTEVFSHLEGVRADFPNARLLCVSQDQRRVRKGAVDCIYWVNLFDELGL